MTVHKKQTALLIVPVLALSPRDSFSERNAPLKGRSRAIDLPGRAAPWTNDRVPGRGVALRARPGHGQVQARSPSRFSKRHRKPTASKS